MELISFFGEGQQSQIGDANALCVCVLLLPLLVKITVILSAIQSWSENLSNWLSLVKLGLCAISMGLLHCCALAWPQKHCVKVRNYFQRLV